MTTAFHAKTQRLRTQTLLCFQLCVFAIFAPLRGIFTDYRYLSTQMSSKIYFPNLDPLRFFAFFAVFVNHAANSLGYHSSNVHVELFKYKYLSNGDLGVSFFFVLSGFLITYLLLKEKEETSGISIRNFYMRRVLRIWPLYFLVVLICLLLTPHLQQFIHGAFPLKIGIAKLNSFLYMSFLGNFDFVYHGISNTLIAPLWSVSVEEQFYLAWPLIIAFVPRKFLLHVFVLLICASVCYRLFLSGGKNVNLKFHTFSSLSDLATGALLAWLSFREKFLVLMRSLPRWKIFVAYALGIALFLNRFALSSLKLNTLLIPAFLPLLFAVFFAFIIAEQNFSERSFLKLAKLRRISALGKYTYGMYCYHMLVFFFILFTLQYCGMDLRHIDKWELAGITLGALVLTIGASKISYIYFERWFLGKKGRFEKAEVHHRAAETQFTRI
jgi:peptidoglycan/LPS O-acetylase OafA/YrhL